MTLAYLDHFQDSAGFALLSKELGNHLLCQKKLDAPATGASDKRGKFSAFSAPTLVYIIHMGYIFSSFILCFVFLWCPTFYACSFCMALFYFYFFHVLCLFGKVALPYLWVWYFIFVRLSLEFYSLVVEFFNSNFISSWVLLDGSISLLIFVFKSWISLCYFIFVP